MLINFYSLTGPSDLGGTCPHLTYQLGDSCCCSASCCLDKCTLKEPPTDCLLYVPNSRWAPSIQTGDTTWKAVQFSKNYQIYNFRILYCHSLNQNMVENAEFFTFVTINQ